MRSFHAITVALRRRTALLLALLLLAGQGMSCARHPVTGQPQLALISEPQEIQMGAQAAEQAIAAIGLVDDDALQAYVQRVGMDLARRSERPDLPWTFRVLDDPTPNAFALPGGYIFLTRGLMAMFNSEAELAGVIGHEIGHITARHSVERISQAQLAQLGLGLGAVLLPELRPLTGLIGTSLELLFLQYGREQEREADQLGFVYALDAGYDVREMPNILIALDQYQRREGVSALPEWLSTHPPTGVRLADAEARLAQVRGPVETLRVGEAEYLARVEGLVYGPDPRMGFFQDGVFYYPDLALSMAFPTGWQTRRLPNVVVASSPQGDAVVQLGPAQGAPDAAARQFLGQAGVQAGQVSQETINGLPAVVADFQARTQQGVVRGLAAFVRHEGRTYGMVTFTPANRFARYQDTFARSIGSFRPVTDPAILNVQPARLAIVELQEAMTAGQFADRYPSVIALDDVLLINQIPSTATRLPAGTRMKRVIRRPPLAQLGS